MSTDKRNRVNKGVSAGGQFAKEIKSEADGVTLGAGTATNPPVPLQSRTERNHLLAQLELLNANDALEWANGVRDGYPNVVSFAVNDPEAESALESGITYQDANGNQVEVDEVDADEFAVECPASDDSWLQAHLRESDEPMTFASLGERYEKALEATRESVRSGDATLQPSTDTTVAAWTGEDGVQVVQIDHAGGTPVRVNVNDAPVFEGDPEVVEHLSVENMFRPNTELRRNLSTPPELPEGYDSESVMVEFDSDGDAYVSIEVPADKGSGKVALWARDVAGVFETGSNIHEGGESVAWENPDDEYDVLEHLEAVATNLHYAKLHAMEKVTKDQGFIEAASRLARRGR